MVSANWLWFRKGGEIVRLCKATCGRGETFITKRPCSSKTFKINKSFTIQNIIFLICQALKLQLNDNNLESSFKMPLIKVLSYKNQALCSIPKTYIQTKSKLNIIP